jgi:hypothetical protein
VHVRAAEHFARGRELEATAWARLDEGFQGMRVMYAALVDGRINQDQTKAHLGVWQGCLKGFGDFVADPMEFLSKPHG